MLQRIQDYKIRGYFLLIYIFSACIFLFFSSSVFCQTWEEVDKGIEYLDIKDNIFSPWSHIHAFKINLNYNQLQSISARQLSMTHASADEFANRSDALIAINSGFFDEDFHPLGLRVNNFKQYNKLKKISWWGVFYVINNKPHISSYKHYPGNKNVQFAIQSGPRLIIDGKVPSLRPGIAERSAICINKKNELILVVTENSPVTTTALAQIMLNAPLNCRYALNLDGGSSTQLKANLADLKFQVKGFSHVSDAIIVKRRKR